MSVTLTGNLVVLRPLNASDAPLLLEAASDGELWNLHFTVIPGPETAEGYVATAMAWYEAGTAMPFVILDRATGQVLGCTRYWKIDRVNRKLEIGHTWLRRSAQRSGVNTEAKYLLLSYAFEEMRCVRVQFTTDELNVKSRAAILRLGAVEEGMIRNERIMPNGRVRNSYRFSIIESEWPEVKRRLEGMMTRPYGEAV